MRLIEGRYWLCNSKAKQQESYIEHALETKVDFHSVISKNKIECIYNYKNKVFLE